MLRKILLLGIVLGLVAFVWTVTPAVAQDPCALKPDTCSVKLENERVRVYEWTLKPGDKEPMHTHPELVAYYLADAKLRVYGPDGKVLREREIKAGDTFWNPPQKHATENIGTTVIHAIIVEFKTNPYKK
jgi:quercetin dioxygenase-like cupin family protein